MKIARQTLSPDVHVIRAYEPGRITINEHVITTSVVVTPDAIHRDLLPEAFSGMTLEHFQRLLEFDPEVLLFGTGSALRFPEQTVMQYMMRHGVGFEVMDTPAACRTYNILMGEDRRVVAAMLIMDAV
ncbi:MAG: Mth938-like domain-containing protein [Gammaproteobacteria bacterium]|jgi:uncharacterized protein